MRLLTPQELDSLGGLIRSAVDRNSLDRILSLSTGDGFDDLVGDIGLKPAIQTIMKGLNGDGRMEPFLKVVYRELPFRADIRATVASYVPEIGDRATEPPLFAVQKGGVPVAEQEGPGLQKVVKPSLAAIDLGVWHARLGAIMRQVCAIEANGMAMGTGFLVGDKAVLTNWHVMRQVRANGGVGAMLCRFDYRTTAGGGLARSVDFGVVRVAAESPCSPAELGANPDNPPPQASELDYALLELSAAAGRDWVRLIAGPPLLADAPLYIVQHPQGLPIRIAQDTQAIIGFTAGGQRLRYRTNTEPGSSGSPCFDAELNLVALHHLGDPSRKPPTYNQGIPSGLLRASIEAAGAGGLLGA